MTSHSNKLAAIDFMTLVAAGKVSEAYDTHVGPGFRHHNPHSRGDAVSLREAMQANAKKNPDKMFQIKIALADGDRVATVSHVRQNPHDRGGVVVHVFRFDGERIAELWDVGQSIPEKMVNENGMF
jgi:predicted SnoaL-like aldol condensation-catalyzing enzyme